jgi:hypothetical protein
MSQVTTIIISQIKGKPMTFTKRPLMPCEVINFATSGLSQRGLYADVRRACRLLSHLWQNDDGGERLPDQILDGGGGCLLFGLHGGSSSTTIREPIEVLEPVDLLRVAVLGNKEAPVGGWAAAGGLGSKTNRTGAFIRLLQETDKGHPPAAVSSRRTGKSRRPRISFISPG